MFIRGFASMGLILFSAGTTYILLIAALHPELLVSQPVTATSSDCTSEPIEGELIVTFSKEISELMQNRILESYSATVEDRQYIDAEQVHIVTIRVDTNNEETTHRMLLQTAGVVAVKQNMTACPS